MTSIFFEIRELFRREKIYFILLIVIVFFYSSVLFLHKSLSKGNQQAAPNMQQIERLLREAPQKPAVLEQRLSNQPWLLWSIRFFILFFISAVGAGIWLGFSDLKRWFLRKEIIPRADEEPHIPWGISEVVRVIILFFSFGILLNLALSFYFAILKFVFDSDTDRSFLMLVHTLVLDVGTVLLILFAVRRSGARTQDLMGFSFSNLPIREIWWGIRTYFVILPVLMGVLILLVYLANRLAYEPPPHPLVNVLLKDQKLSFGILFSSIFVACVLGPIVEEIFFRGFFYPAVRKYWGVGRTMAVTAALFALMHENIFSFLPIFFLGLVLCYLYEKRANLLSCISLHMLHNTTFLIYFFLLKSVFISG